MLFAVVWWTCLWLGIGVVAALSFWTFMSAKRRALRLIDLTSYAFTIAAFGSAFFSIHHYEERFQDIFERMKIHDVMADTAFDDADAYSQICGDVQLVGVKRTECRQLRELLQSLQVTDIFQPKIRQPPDVSVFTVPELRSLASKIATHVLTANKKLSTYEEKSAASRLDENERLFLSLAVPVLAFAFGLGICRRALDLYSDWNRN